MAQFKVVGTLDDLDLKTAPSVPEANIQQGQQAQNQRGLLDVVGGLGTRAAETFASTGSDISRAPQRLASWATGGYIPSPEKQAETEQQLVGQLAEKGIKAPEKSFLRYSPTEQEGREFTKKLTGERFEPKSDYEKSAQEGVQDLTSMLTTDLLLGPAQTVVRAATKAGISSLAGQLGKQAAKSAGFSEDASNNIKLGTMIFASLLGTRADLKSQMKTDYSKAGEAAKGAVHEAKDLESQVFSFIDKYQNANPAKEFDWQRNVADQAKRIWSKIQSGKIKVEDAIELKRELNELIYGWSAGKGKPLLEKMRNGLNGILKEYGETNAQFGVPWKQAEEIFAATSMPNVFKSVINGSAKLKDIVKDPILRTALGLGGGYGAIDPIKMAGKFLYSNPQYAALALGGRELYKFGKLLAQSPTARAAYAVAAVESTTRNLPGIAKQLKILNKEAEKFSKKEEKTSSKNNQASSSGKFKVVGVLPSENQEGNEQNEIQSL